MTTAEILRAARDLIANPAHWTQRTFRRGDQFCASGACGYVAGQGSAYDGASLLAIRALDAAARRVYPDVGTVEYVNDTLGHEAVLRVFDEAISGS